jgi:hypothetical protein
MSISSSGSGQDDKLAPRWCFRKFNMEAFRLLTEDFTIIRASGAKQDREAFLGAVATNAHRGRTAEEPEIRLYHGCAVVIIRVTTSEKQDGALIARRFWNTRVFFRQEDQWRCATWQVTETRDEIGR